MSDKDNSSTFLSRWSNRKQQVRDDEKTVSVSSSDKAVDEHQIGNLNSAATPVVEVLGESLLGVEADIHAPVPISVEGVAQDPLSVGVESDNKLENKALTDTPVLTDADMPPIESLVASSDMSGFFSAGVSAALRKAALRHVFSQPQFNVRDGLNDYDGDYTVFEPLGDTITADMKFHTARKERNRLEAAEEEKRLAAEAAATEEERLASEASSADESLADADESDIDSSDEEAQARDADNANEELAAPIAGNENQQTDQQTADAADRNSANTTVNTLAAERIEKTV